jgi:hypothetical protein
VGGADSAMAGQPGPFEAWGGAQLLCDPEPGWHAWCAAAMLQRDGPNWGARCLRLPAGAMGNASSGEGDYCICTEARSGPGCLVVNRGARLVLDLADVLQIAAMAYLIRRALRTYELLLKFDRAGSNRVMMRALRWIGVVCVTHVVSSVCLIVEGNAAYGNLSHDSVVLVNTVFDAAELSCTVVGVATVTVTFYTIIARADHRAPSAWHDPAAKVFAAVICITVVAVAIVAPQVYTLVYMAGGVTLIVPAFDSGCKVKRLLDADQSAFKSDVLVLAALKRVQWVLRHALLFTFFFLALRVVRATTGWAESVYQGPAFYVQNFARCGFSLLGVYMVRRDARTLTRLN